jgi:hypothetical protein
MYFITYSEALIRLVLRANSQHLTALNEAGSAYRFASKEDI